MEKELLKTRPKYPESEATEEGWVDKKTGELLVAIKNLKTRLGSVTVKRGRGRPKKIKE